MATATPTRSPERRRQPGVMTREESMLWREAYDFLEHKCALHFNRGPPEDKETDDKDVDITVRTTAIGTQDTTVRQENTQLGQTNGTSSETTAIPNGIRCSPVIILRGRGEPIIIDNNNITCSICNEKIVRDKDRGHVISDGCKCNLDYHYKCLLTAYQLWSFVKDTFKLASWYCSSLPNFYPFTEFDSVLNA
jgi:hypothetical protein